MCHSHSDLGSTLHGFLQLFGQLLFLASDWENTTDLGCFSTMKVIGECLMCWLFQTIVVQMMQIPSDCQQKWQD